MTIATLQVRLQRIEKEADEIASFELVAPDGRELPPFTAGAWTGDHRRALALARRLEAGTVYLNHYRSVSTLSPAGGYKNSGYGRENGIEAMGEYLQTKSVWLGLGPVANPFPAAASTAETHPSTSSG